MERSQLLRMIDAGMIDRLYRYCYARTSCSHEAEELCSDILYAVVKSCNNVMQLTNPTGYFWSVAHNVYADYCKKRRIQAENCVAESDELMELIPDTDADNGFDNDSDEEKLSAIYHHISNLSVAYRKVMVGYYLEGKSAAQLATELSVSETTVRQRLFAARNEVRKRVMDMNRTVVENKPALLDEMHWAEWGTGSPFDGDPREVCTRQLSKHVVWLCRKKPKTARKISDELGVPMLYVEEELDIQVRGTNGRYGMLCKTDSGRYIANCIILDENEIRKLQQLYINCIPEITDIVVKHIDKNKDVYCAFPYINEKPDLNLILWQQISCIADAFSDCVESKLKNTYMSDIKPSKRPFTVFCYRMYDGCNEWGGGWDGIEASDICGYRHIVIENIYIRRIKPHFRCGCNISNDAKLRMAIRSVKGLSVGELTPDEEEIAAKCIECGYLYRDGNTLYTKFLVNREEDSPGLFKTTGLLYSAMPEETVNRVAKAISDFVRNSIPEHLLCDYLYVNRMACIPVLDMLVEELIKKGILTPPENGTGAEGIWMSVK